MNAATRRELSTVRVESRLRIPEGSEVSAVSAVVCPHCGGVNLRHTGNPSSDAVVINFECEQCEESLDLVLGRGSSSIYWRVQEAA